MVTFQEINRSELADRDQYGVKTHRQFTDRTHAAYAIPYVASVKTKSIQ